MPILPSPAGAVADTPVRRRGRERQLVRWATLAALLLLAAVAVSRA